MSLASPSPASAAAAAAPNNNSLNSAGGGGGGGVDGISKPPYQPGRGGGGGAVTPGNVEGDPQDLASPSKHRSGSAGSKMMAVRVQMLDESITLFKVQVSIGSCVVSLKFLC